MNKLKEYLKPFYHRVLRAVKFYRRIGLENRDFTILSNNCTAGYVYQYFGLKYNTPTAGLFFTAEDYLKMVDNPEKYLKKSELRFINPLDSKNYEFYKNSYDYGNYPVAELDDIEIYFMHYHDEKSAASVWNRRAKRTNLNNTFYLFSENESFNNEILQKFVELKSTNKLCLTYNDYNINSNYIKRDLRAESGAGNVAWFPFIVLSSLPWKNVLNDMLKKQSQFTNE